MPVLARPSERLSVVPVVGDELVAEESRDVAVRRNRPSVVVGDFCLSTSVGEESIDS